MFRVLSDESFCGTDPRGIPIHLFALPQLAIREIIVGANASRLTLSQIFRFVHQHQIPAQIYQAYVDSETFELKRRPISLGYRNPNGMYLESEAYQYPQLKDLQIDELEPFQAVPPVFSIPEDDEIVWSVAQTETYGRITQRTMISKVKFDL